MCSANHCQSFLRKCLGAVIFATSDFCILYVVKIVSFKLGLIPLFTYLSCIFKPYMYSISNFKFSDSSPCSLAIIKPFLSLASFPSFLLVLLLHMECLNLFPLKPFCTLLQSVSLCCFFFTEQIKDCKTGPCCSFLKIDLCSPLTSYRTCKVFSTFLQFAENSNLIITSSLFS